MGFTKTISDGSPNKFLIIETACGTHTGTSFRRRLKFRAALRNGLGESIVALHTCCEKKSGKGKKEK